MGLKSSNYNVIVPIEGNETILFNTLTGRLILINSNEKIVDSIIKDPNSKHEDLNEDIKNNLIKRNFIIDSEIDELDLIKKNYKKSMMDDTILRLTILPTLKCNFRCTYCWESLQGKNMDIIVQNSIINFIKSNIKNYKLVDIGWFGGEPLVHSKSIEYLGNNIKKICEDNNVKYTSGIATNGYLLTQENITMLNDTDVRSLVVTLDGPPEIHNKRRVLADGGESFDKILFNIKTMSKYISHINIGINCDYENIEYIDELLDYLEDVKQSVSIYFRWIFPDADKWSEYYQNSTHRSEAAKDNKEIIKLNWLAVKRGFTIRNPIFKPKNVYCNSEYKNHYIIDPEGKIYKCNVNCELKKPIGNLEEDGNLIVNSVETEKWYSGEKVENTNCNKCKLLPVCKGGCAYAYLETNTNKCVLANTENLSEYVKMEYYKLTHKNSTEVI